MELSTNIKKKGQAANELAPAIQKFFGEGASFDEISKSLI